VDPTFNNLLQGDARDMRTEKFGQLRPFGDLVFNYRLDILLFLLSTILLLDIFYRATAEVVGSVLFRDNVSTSGPGATDICGKTPDFRLDLCSLDLVRSGFQLLSLLLESDDVWIRGKRC
jgi:hypothetical protein